MIGIRRRNGRWVGQAALGPIAMLVVAAVLLSAWPVEAASAKVIRTGPRSSGAVALTFDDGWGASSCERIAKTLRRKRVKATFFINGVHLKAEPDRWRAILKGMPVANHTRTHVNLATASDTLIRKQIHHNEALHEKILGRRMIKVLRPPYGAYDSAVKRVARSLGYKHIALWSHSAADTSPRATVRSIIRRTTGARPGSIILMHCARSMTADALPAIIRHYKKRGIKLVGLDEMLNL